MKRGGRGHLFSSGPKSKGIRRSLLDQVERGEVIVITRHGTPVAKLVPYEEGFDSADGQRAADEFREFRRGNVLPKGLFIRDLVNDGRR